MKHASFFGCMAEFENPTELVQAAEKVYADGYRKIDTYSPFPIEAAAEAVGFHKSRLSLIVLIGGLTGLATAFGIEYCIFVIDYPINVGGPPLHFTSAFIIFF